MAEVLQVTIRPLQECELEAVERCFPGGDPRRHRDRLARQQSGEAVYLIAWAEELPVGHLLIRFTGAGSELVASQVGDCPHVQDLLVAPGWRSRGIGSRLLVAAEQEAAQRGFPQLGLSVATENTGARRFYAHRGYKDSELGEYPTGGSYLGEDGEVRSWCDLSVYLVKRL